MLRTLSIGILIVLLGAAGFYGSSFVLKPNEVVLERLFPDPDTEYACKAVAETMVHEDRVSEVALRIGRDGKSLFLLTDVAVRAGSTQAAEWPIVFSNREHIAARYSSTLENGMLALDRRTLKGNWSYWLHPGPGTLGLALHSYVLTCR
jgi:hypothetical protein